MHRNHSHPPRTGQVSSAFLHRQGAFALVLMACVGMTACRTIEPKWDVPEGKPFVPQNFARSEALPASVQRVVLLPAFSAEWRASDLAAVEAALSSELGKVERFEIIPVGRAALRARLGAEAVLSSATLPADFLPRLRTDLGADAVMFLDITHFGPYQPISIGLRAKLVDVADGRVFWSFDAVFDSAQPGMAVAARRYYLEHNRAAPPLDDATGILQSPARFARFVGFSVFGTLPGREPQKK